MLLISDAPEATWLPPGWIFGAVLERLAAAVPAEAEELRLAIEADGAYAVDLREWPVARFAPLATAARTVTRELLEAGPEPDWDPHRFSAAAFGFSLIAGLLSADPRAGWTPPASRRIVISSDATWEAPGAVHALVCEHLAAGLWPTSGLLALHALREGTDFTGLESARFDVASAAIRFMAARYAPGVVLDAAADAYFAEVAPRITALLELLDADPRSFASARRTHQRWLETGGVEGTRLDLPRVELVDLDLSRAPLREARLPEAILVGVALSEADLRKANLYGLYATRVSFAGAHLDGAELVKAELHSADLSGASLRETRMRRLECERTGFAGADFTGADLSGAMLVDADLRNTTFAGADLSFAVLTGARIDGITGVPAAADGLRCEWVELDGERVGGAALFAALGLTQHR